MIRPFAEGGRNKLARTPSEPRSVEPSGPAPQLTAEIALSVAWSGIGIATVVNEGRYTSTGVLILTGCTALLLVAIAGRVPCGKRPQRIMALGLATTAAVYSATFFPSGLYGIGWWLAISRMLTLACAVLVALWILLRLPRPQAASYGIIALMGFSALALLASDPRPLIDVWYMLQAETAHAGNLVHLYGVHWTSGIKGGVRNEFVYLPGLAVMLWPFHALFGDVRYGLWSADMVTALLLVRMARQTEIALAGTLILLYPGSTYGLEQAWVDPLMLCLLCSAALLAHRGHRFWPVLLFGASLTCKQTAWLLVPLACFWPAFGLRRTLIAVVGALAFIAPWAISSPHAFYTGAIHYNLTLPPRLDSMSLFTTALVHGWHPSVAVTAIVVVASLVLVAVRAPRTTFGFFVGAGALMAVFNLTDKQSFYNEWLFASQLLLLACVFGGTLTSKTTRADGDAIADDAMATV